VSIETLKPLLEAWTGGNDWEVDDDNVLVFHGEHADGEPSWYVTENYGYHITFEIGWYTQDGECAYHDEIIPLMEAMVAASNAFSGYYRAKEQPCPKD
jgi:hypothetical protein